MSTKHRIAFIGGGAAGFFGAINAAEKAHELGLDVQITIFESSSKYLKKVKISGGGRCNVTHNLFEVRPFCENYPRGQKALLSPMQNFQAKDTLAWFKRHGIEIVAEQDGRMFPTSNDSQTIIDCYLSLVEKYGIELAPNHKIENIKVDDSGEFNLEIRNQDNRMVDAVVIATGSAPGGYPLATSLGHTITDRAPSLFSFKIQDPILHDLQGLSFETSLKLIIEGKKTFKQFGPSLITHWGLSGPAILKLSAWAAREMNECHYQAKLMINWMGTMSLSEIEQQLHQIKDHESKSLIKNSYPESLPKRFWTSVLGKLAIDQDKQWANVTKKELSKLSQELGACTLEVLGQNRFKDEFVECGGVDLKEINFKTMESKIQPNLYFAGEILDVDGITGGFNFQNAWTTSWTAAQTILSKI